MIERLDPKLFEELGREIAQTSRVVIADRCGHWISEERPEVLAQAILDLAKEAEV